MRRLAVLAVVLVAAVPACGNGDDSPPVAEAEITAVDNRFEPERIVTPPGRVEFSVVNEGAVPHTFVIAGLGFKLKPFETGEIKRGVVDLEPGEVLFYCDIEGHREDGMEGVLVVQEDADS